MPETNPHTHTRAQDTQQELDLSYRTMKPRVMRRIYALYVLYQLTSPTLLKCYVAAVAIAGVASVVSLGHVLANMPPLYDVTHMSLFSVHAFVETEFTVQILTVTAIAAIAAMLLPLERHLAWRKWGRMRKVRA